MSHSQYHEFRNSSYRNEKKKKKLQQLKTENKTKLQKKTNFRYTDIQIAGHQKY